MLEKEITDNKFQILNCLLVFEHPLEERCHQFAKRIRRFCRKLRMDIANFEDVKQLIRASGSVAANYIEANDALGQKDFLCHARISRRECKESRYFLDLLVTAPETELDRERLRLFQEASELVHILRAIIRKCE